ncbi:hypothetical protein BJ322DRAFT_1077750 [Thelephora terrestris]|uniref:BTB domain-containing protein n=1 Tax=Thelephora terrestris TaxID=56493 RepID=A0A9P6HBG1_9AGAM|nr:hypothetical protein BJ322DRAFT_1077750 [Thelephora terrestris]
MSLPQALGEALFDSLSTGTFVDVKFYAFSQRTPSGRVRCPKSLYANSHILQTVPYFRSLLSDGFSEGKLKDLRSPFPLDQPLEWDGHNCLDDSDLEEIEDNENLRVEIPGVTSDNLRSPLKSPVFGSGFCSPFLPQIPELGSTGAVSSICGTRSVGSDTHLGRVAVLRDISFVTLRAVLFFLYTGEITFAHPSAVGNRAQKSADARDFSASAKSIYLTADKYDIPELKTLALKWIRATIHTCDIMQELASDFTATFPEIREICLEQLASALCGADRANVTKNLMSAIRSSVRGDPDSTIDPETRGAIFDMLTNGYTPTSRIPYAAPTQSRPPDWSYLREALRKSLISGKFLDGQIRAYRGRSKAKKLTRPSSIYFSTASIPPVTMSAIGHESMTRPPSEHEYDSDSDLEGGEDEESKPYEVGVFRKVNIPPVAIMKYGSWNTWRATLYFVYSHKVSFAPIRSQNVTRLDSSELLPLGSCSPKSAFMLAEKTAVWRLRDQAREDLFKKITKENIMTEYFSKFANSHPSLLCAINDIVRKTRNAETDAIIRKKFVGSTGDDPHVSAALELFLQNMIDENNRRIIGRCSNCLRGYTALQQAKEGRCNICVGEPRNFRYF